MPSSPPAVSRASSRDLPRAPAPMPWIRLSIIAAGAVLLFLSTAGLVNFVIQMKSGAATGTQTAGGSHFDLDSCMGKVTYESSRCPAGAAVACWSVSPSAQWKCWSAAEAPSWTATALGADVHCRAEVSGPLYGYSGACTLLTPARTPTHSAPLLPLPSWSAAYAKAKQTLVQMTPDEKHTLLQGVGWNHYDLQKWWYVGNTGAIPRLNIPSLNMQDAAGGFRTYWNELVGTVTCFPSLLSMAATWDPQAVRDFGVGLGEEFSGKGANGILGPSVDVHRVARSGRNFEFLSGEDPFLGSKLARAYVQGVQSKGVFAVMKHWIFDSQETNRGSESSVVDEKTANELYYPPFQAAVDAGVSAAMCSYNRIDGEYSCSNQKQLTDVLRKQMGFKGFVQSDWWATHATTLYAGLDQEMPGSGASVYYGAPNLVGQNSQAVDEAAIRVLAVVHRMNLTSDAWCAPPNCQSSFMRNVTTASHVALARSLAAESVVLLQNNGDVLPLGNSDGQMPLSIAVIGSAATAPVYNPNGHNQGEGGWQTGDYYAGGGSGHVVPGSVVTALDGIQRRAELGGMRVIVAATNEIGQAITAAQQVDVAIIVAGATSGESIDRANLNLDNGADNLIASVAKVAKKIVVLLQVPGAVLMPWREDVDGILTLFLGGQETGNAWADVIFGDHAPTGRLPLMIPVSEADTIPPNPAPVVTYSEGMATSYRNKNFKAAFPFGHGLTYTTFKYSEPFASPCPEPRDSTQEKESICIHVLVRNVGRKAARTMVQLYLEFSFEAGHPTPLLKGFQKTGVLLPGDGAEVTLALSAHDLSYYNNNGAAWQEADSVVAHIGESSADIRVSLSILKAAGVWKDAGLVQVSMQSSQTLKIPSSSVSSAPQASARASLDDATPAGPEFLAISGGQQEHEGHGEVAVRMKRSDLPVSWHEGMSVTLKYGGQRLHGTVSMIRPMQQDLAYDSNHGPETGRSSANAIAWWLAVLVIIVIGVMALGVYSRTKVAEQQGTAQEKGTPSEAGTVVATSWQAGMGSWEPSLRDVGSRASAVAINWWKAGMNAAMGLVAKNNVECGNTSKSHPSRFSAVPVQSPACVPGGRPGSATSSRLPLVPRSPPRQGEV